jgi:hypothetical protein
MSLPMMDKSNGFVGTEKLETQYLQVLTVNYGRKLIHKINSRFLPNLTREESGLLLQGKEDGVSFTFVICNM